MPMIALNQDGEYNILGIDSRLDQDQYFDGETLIAKWYYEAQEIKVEIYTDRPVNFFSNPDIDIRSFSSKGSLSINLRFASKFDLIIEALSLNLTGKIECNGLTRLIAKTVVVTEADIRASNLYTEAECTHVIGCNLNIHENMVVTKELILYKTHLRARKLTVGGHTSFNDCAQIELTEILSLLNDVSVTTSFIKGKTIWFRGKLIIDDLRIEAATFDVNMSEGSVKKLRAFDTEKLKLKFKGSIVHTDCLFEDCQFTSNSFCFSGNLHFLESTLSSKSKEAQDDIFGALVLTKSTYKSAHNIRSFDRIKLEKSVIETEETFHVETEASLQDQSTLVCNKIIQNRSKINVFHSTIKIAEQFFCGSTSNFDLKESFLKVDSFSSFGKLDAAESVIESRVYHACSAAEHALENTSILSDEMTLSGRMTISDSNDTTKKATVFKASNKFQINSNGHVVAKSPFMIDAHEVINRGVVVSLKKLRLLGKQFENSGSLEAETLDLKDCCKFYNIGIFSGRILQKSYSVADAFILLGFGLIQIGVGSLLVVNLTSFRVPTGLRLLQSGVDDILSAYYVYKAENFSWCQYWLQKKITILSHVLVSVKYISDKNPSTLKQLVTGAPEHMSDSFLDFSMIHRDRNESLKGYIVKYIFTLVFEKMAAGFLIKKTEDCLNYFLLKKEYYIQNIFENIILNKFKEKSLDRTIKQLYVIDMINKDHYFEDKIMSLCRNIVSSSQTFFQKLPVVQIFHGIYLIYYIVNSLYDQFSKEVTDLNSGAFSTIEIFSIFCEMNIEDAAKFVEILNDNGILVEKEVRDLGRFDQVNFADLILYKQRAREILCFFGNSNKKFTDAVFLLSKNITKKLTGILKEQIVLPILSQGLYYFIQALSEEVQDYEIRQNINKDKKSIQSDITGFDSKLINKLVRNKEYRIKRTHEYNYHRCDALLETKGKLTYKSLVYFCMEEQHSLFFDALNRKQKQKKIRDSDERSSSCDSDDLLVLNLDPAMSQYADAFNASQAVYNPDCNHIGNLELLSSRTIQYNGVFSFFLNGSPEVPDTAASVISVYRNVINNNIYIAFEGTAGRWSSCFDTSSMIFGMLPDSAHIAVLLFNTITADIKNNYPGSNIILTGHSKGAALATLCSCLTGYKAIVFDNPGLSVPPDFSFERSFDYSRVISIQSTTNMVNISPLSRYRGKEISLNDCASPVWSLIRRGLGIFNGWKSHKLEHMGPLIATYEENRDSIFNANAI